jgi:hypothetical protein
VPIFFGVQRLPIQPKFSDVAGRPLQGIAGFWDFSFQGFTALNERARETRLYEPGEGIPIKISQLSPLVQSLISAEEQRIKLFSFFVPVPYKKLDDSDYKAAFAAMSDKIVAHFPQVVATFLQAGLTDAVTTDRPLVQEESYDD